MTNTITAHGIQTSPALLTAWQTVAQSALCHPDWDPATHLDFLAQEGYDVAAELVEAWLTDPDHPGYIRPATNR